ncbi:MAG TPA: MotA/TolQ/ExbB proton channel family protein [Gemmataceae bacterium]
MRRTLILTVLPFTFCLIPLLAAALIVLALPTLAKQFYIDNLSSLDQLILGLGSALFLAQLLLAWRALRWRGLGFDERPDKWLSNLAQGAEWFPLLGLLGTVAGILQTFSKVGASSEALAPQLIISLYAPAITATGSGLFMALLNIFPTWIVLVGRQLILSLAGGEVPTEEEEPAGSAALSNPR